MKKLFITSAMSVLFLAASVFAFTNTGAAYSCPLKESAQTSAIDYSKVVVARADDNCCQPGADCCKGGVCCKHKRN
jgi:hypothetical protein